MSNTRCTAENCVYHMRPPQGYGSLQHSMSTPLRKCKVAVTDASSISAICLHLPQLPCAEHTFPSCRYAWECQTPEGGWGLDQILRDSSWKFRGIVNGMDYNEWSPQQDVHLQSDGYQNYSQATLREGKAKCKEALQRVWCVCTLCFVTLTVTCSWEDS